MSSVRIRTRTTRRGQRRYMVAYRLGGRYGRDRSAGTFHKLTHARQRQAKVQELIARGHHDQIEELANPAANGAVPEPEKSWTALHQQWLDGTHNLKPSTRRTYQRHGQALAHVIGDRDPTAFSWRDCRDLVTQLVERGLAPRTVKAYVDTFRLVLDYAGVKPNLARDRRVKLPHRPAKQPNIPTRAHIQAIRNHLPSHLLLPFDTLEATGMRIGELNQLTWADLDVPGSRLRIAEGKTRAARRWVNLPPGLTTRITATRPLGDNTERRRLFPQLHRSTIGYAIRKACKHAGIPHYHPHDLRDRWISLALKQGLPPAEVARDAGHARQSITLDTYSHVITDPDDHNPLAWETYGHNPTTHGTQPKQQSARTPYGRTPTQ